MPINRERFMLDLDSEGFPIPDHTPFGLINLGKSADHPTVQALLADYKCTRCRGLLMTEEQANELLNGGTRPWFQPENPEGWQEVDGVKLPPITWGAVVESAQSCANINMDGITRLSDSYAPDAFYGWRK